MSNSSIGLEVLPTGQAEYPVGFALDIGASLTKLVYRDKRNPKNMQIALFARNDTQNLVEYIKENVDMKNSDDRACFCTGVGIKSFGQAVSEKLGVKIELEQEFMYSSKAFHYLEKSLPQDQFFAPISRTAFEYGYNLAKGWTEGWENDTMGGVGTSMTLAADTSETMYRKYNEHIEKLYPCLTVTFGSGCIILLLNEDGTTEFVDYSNRGGRTFLGLGAIITGAKTFDELMDLASKGNGKNCNTVIGDLHDDREDHDIYCKTPTDFNCFFYGKAMGKTKDDFRREDLANALVDYICQDICQLISYVAKTKNISNVYFMGSFLNHEVTREMLTRCFVEISIKQTAMKLLMRIVPLGSHFPAMGAWLRGCEKNQSERIIASQVGDNII